MPKKINLASAGNVLVPAYLSLRKKGYQVFRVFRQLEKSEIWYATKGGNRFITEDPLSLLGLVVLFESRGADWQGSDVEIDAFLKRYL